MKNLIYISIISTLFMACGGSEAPSSEATGDSLSVEHHVLTLSAEETRLAGVQTGTVEQKTISYHVQASGKLDVPPNNKVSISAPMQGVVRTTSVLQGTHVHKGEVIAELEHADYIQLQQDYLDYSSQLEYLQAEHKRQEELAGEQINAKKTAQQSKSAYLSMQAKVQGVKAKLQLIGVDVQALERSGIKPFVVIKSPINGYITKVNINMGSYVGPNDIMFEVVNTEHLHAELTVFEKDIMNIKTGQKVVFTLGNETKERTAEVHLVGREIHADRSVQVHCHLDVEDPGLIPGTYLKAMIETSNHQSTALPDEAIVGFEGVDYVFVQTAANTYKMVEVKKGNSERGYTEVWLPQGVPADAKIVIKGCYSLLGKLKNNEE
jgi:cobalt-zinc-cadmium efflux system membrane fusion protein